MKRRTLLQAGPTLALASGLTSAQTAYPVKPIRYIVPVAAGGGSDMVGAPSRNAGASNSSRVSSSTTRVVVVA